MNMPPLAAVRHSLAREQMQAFARSLAGLSRQGDIISLKGEVGAGKTTFARAFIEAIAMHAPQVTSPTFNLMQSYDVRLGDGKEDTLWHLDLYRLKDPRELDALGIRELLPHLMLIEWPEIMEAFLPQEQLSILFEFGETEASRTLIVRGDALWKDRIVKGGV